MDDARLWGSEEGLWTADPEQYRQTIDDECLMVLPDAPHVFSGAEAVAAVSRTPRWSSVAFSAQAVARPQEGLIVIAYAVTAQRDEQSYSAHCTTTYRRLEHEVWRVIQHQQSPTG
ncbi:MAG: DUF4440 domain-containing protein [Brevundimonas sp.]|nr:MAG: DUF4440 domain-containing protein [Brevundimonas sp.]